MPLQGDRPFPKRARLIDKTSYQGIRGYFVTTNTHQCKPFFTKSNIVSSAINYLDVVSKVCEIDVVSYCFMPDHLHLVLSGNFENSNLEIFMNRYKQKTGFHFKKVFKLKLWSTSYHDRVLRKTEEIRSVGRYTLLNPVKAGLVNDILDYPFCGSFVYRLEELVGVDHSLS